MTREEEEVVGVYAKATTTTNTTTGMLLQRFLGRLSGRRRQQQQQQQRRRWRRRQRHVRRFSSSSGRPGARTAAGKQPRRSVLLPPPPSPILLLPPPQLQQQQQQQQQPPQASVAMEQSRYDEEELLLLCCCRCRSGRSCSCAFLGLDQVDEDVDDDTVRGRTRTRCSGITTTTTTTTTKNNNNNKTGLTTLLSSSYDGWQEQQHRQQDCGCADRDVLRRRPPECSELEQQQEQKQSQRKRRWPTTSRSRSSLIPSYLATLLILSYSLIGMADACSSRSTPKPRPPTPTPRPNITFHMYTCPPDYAEWYCLNGATCFTVKIVESLLYNCLCANGYIGQRCEFKDLDGSYLPGRQRVMLETASIAGAVTIAVFLAVITFISVYIHCKRKQKELRTSSGVDAVDGVSRDPELRPFCSRSRSLMIFMAKNPNSSVTPSIEQTKMPNWNYLPEASTRMSSVNENKRPSQ